MPTIFVTFLMCLSAQASPAPAAHATRFEKLQAALDHLGIADEESHYDELKIFDGSQTRQGFETILKYIDPYKALQRYIRWDDERVTLFRDRDTRAVVDFSLAFKPSGAPTDPTGLLAALREAATQNPATRPLQGLRVALDPGHMGGTYFDSRTKKTESWDVKTGKYVRTAGGKVSEGEIAFYTCMLLSRELEQLGADVLVTRLSLGPVFEPAIDRFDLEPFARSELLSETDSRFFDELLANHTIGADLNAALDRERVFENLKRESMRDTYFISRADLRARAEKINAFRPQLTLVVHFDAEHESTTQNQYNHVRGYVPGALLSPDQSSHPASSSEVASRESRDMALRNLIDGHRWVESSVFTASVVKGISKAAGIPLLTAKEDYMAVRVADGVYARNLALNRLVSQGVMTYVEVEHYDYTPEFKKLTHKNKHAEVNGVAFDYPARLDDVAEGMKRGILDYVSSLRQPAVAQLPTPTP